MKNHAVFSSYPSLRFPHAAPCLSQKSDSAARGISWARPSPPAVDYESRDGWNSSPPPLKPGRTGSAQDWNLETKLSGLFTLVFCCFLSVNPNTFTEELKVTSTRSRVSPCELRLRRSEERVRRVFLTVWTSLSELSVCSAEKSESSVPSELLPAFL